MLHQQHLKMFLLTVDPLGANLALKRSRSGAVTHMQMHRRESRFARERPGTFARVFGPEGLG